MQYSTKYRNWRCFVSDPGGHQEARSRPSDQQHRRPRMCAVGSRVFTHYGQFCAACDRILNRRAVAGALQEAVINIQKSLCISQRCIFVAVSSSVDPRCRLTSFTLVTVNAFMSWAIASIETHFPIIYNGWFLSHFLAWKAESSEPHSWRLFLSKAQLFVYTDKNASASRNL